jgi:fumarylacetoacetate (FAA) hydrolase family protein
MLQSYDNVADQRLPIERQGSNLLGVQRLIDGVWTRKGSHMVNALPNPVAGSELFDSDFSTYSDTSAVFVGRAWIPAARRHGVAGASLITVRGGEVHLLSHSLTMSDLLDVPDVVDGVRQVEDYLGEIGEFVRNSEADSLDPQLPHLLAPVDLQVIKACGVTFAASMIERVLEERAKGDPAVAASLRSSLRERFGDNLSAVRPGSEQAAEMKRVCIEHGVWSQYLEVGIGEHAEVFTKAPVLSSVGIGARVGVRGDSTWNNPEPEAVMLVNARNELVGATLGNDVNLRDFEGRSALLLGEAKDNNASCSIGPLIRLFDDRFTLETLLASPVRTTIHGVDGFVVHDSYELSEIARHPRDLVLQVGGRTHQYPDGYALFLGTGFAPTMDRSNVGEGFTHMIGDRVVISNKYLGQLWNTVGKSEDLPQWTVGIRDFWRTRVGNHYEQRATSPTGDHLGRTSEAKS